MAQFDAIVIGGGHNGLTAAGYLGKAGLNVLVLEKNAVVGGAAVSEEFHPGYKNSVASYVVSLLQSQVINDLELKKYGFSTIPLKGAFYPRSNGEYLLLTGDEKHDRAQMDKFDKRGYDAMCELYGIVEKIGPALSDQWLRQPPKLHGGGLSDLMSAMKAGWNLKSLDEEGRQRFVQFMVGSARAIVERYFENETLKAVFCAGCMAANYASLYQPGSAMPMLHHAVGELDGVKGQWGLAKGGMGAITQAMAQFCQANNVTIKTNADVSNIIIDNGKAIGARLQNGEAFFAKVVLTNTDPHRTFKKLVKAEHLNEKFVKDIDMWRMESASMRMNLALSGVPNFKALPSNSVGEHHKCFINIVNSADAIEDAYRSARHGELPIHPIMEILIPSTMDDSLTQPGHHVMSILCKYVPYQLSGERHWNDERENAADYMINYLRNYITNLDEILVARQVLTPWDIEQRFGMTRGDICHGRLEPDQLFSMRPHPQCAQYATPIQGLYLCGSGTHPGGGVTGAPGHNAAKRVLKDWR